MKTKAVRLHGAGDLRLDEFELPEITDDEILAEVISDSLCMSTYKCASLGAAHKRVHDDVADHPQPDRSCPYRYDALHQAWRPGLDQDFPG